MNLFEILCKWRLRLVRRLEVLTLPNLNPSIMVWSTIRVSEVHNHATLILKIIDALGHYVHKKITHWYACGKVHSIWRTFVLQREGEEDFISSRNYYVSTELAFMATYENLGQCWWFSAEDWCIFTPGSAMVLSGLPLGYGNKTQTQEVQYARLIDTNKSGGTTSPTRSNFEGEWIGKINRFCHEVSIWFKVETTFELVNLQPHK